MKAPTWSSNLDGNVSVANAALAMAFQGARPASSPHAAHIRHLLTTHGLQLREHPMWLSVTSVAPHDGVIRRLAHAIGVSLPPVEVGYTNSDEFVAQLQGFVAWYAVPRSSPAHSTVIMQLASLGSQLRASGSAGSAQGTVAASSIGYVVAACTGDCTIRCWCDWCDVVGVQMELVAAPL